MSILVFFSTMAKPNWVFFLCTSILSSPFFMSHSQQHSFTLSLIHPDSIFSPYYNPKHTIHDRAELARTTSMARFAFLTSRAKNSSSSSSPFQPFKTDFQTEVIPEHIGTLFMARISFGEPPVSQLVAVDTGSTLLWIQCQPCITCFDQLEEIFDPSKSSTYQNVPCKFHECTSFPLHRCDRKNNCIYTVSYLDGTSSNGLLSFEQLTVGTSDDGVAKIPSVVIGCANENKVTLKDGQHGQISGILGLGPRSESLIHKVGKKFSYCVGNINDVAYPFNQLSLGEAARLEGYSTPMHLGSHDYLITLEGISLGEKRLGVTREAFQGGQWVRAGVMIDTGTTYTYLATQGYTALKNEITSLMEGLMEQVPYGKYELELCYKGDMRRDLKGFPVTTFHLADGVDLVVDVDGMFRQVDYDAFCMAVVDAGASKGFSILGILAQQYYNVGYDVDGQRIYFQRIDCQVLVS